MTYEEARQFMSEPTPLPAELPEHKLAEKPNRSRAFRDKLHVRLGEFKLRSREFGRYVLTHKTGRLLTVQVLFAAVALVGVALIWSAPIALLVGGVGGVLAVERQ